MPLSTVRTPTLLRYCGVLWTDAHRKQKSTSHNIFTRFFQTIRTFIKICRFILHSLESCMCLRFNIFDKLSHVFDLNALYGYRDCKMLHPDRAAVLKIMFVEEFFLLQFRVVRYIQLSMSKQQLFYRNGMLDSFNFLFFNQQMRHFSVSRASRMSALFGNDLRGH